MGSFLFPPLSLPLPFPLDPQLHPSFKTEACQLVPCQLVPKNWYRKTRPENSSRKTRTEFLQITRSLKLTVKITHRAL